ncbi:perineurial glial growth [Tritrichomonas musculus]|uniref:Perineurial glial growth n=1 Tax=Tritrichomonas musculus TaxID=1915356 RepID=A0ABR2KMH1_9EUKA
MKNNEEQQLTSIENERNYTYFEVQAFRNPKSDIKLFCTFAATSEKFIDQKYYRCNTCGLSAKKSMGICEHCMKCCHKGHDVCLAFDADASVQSFCDCPGKCKCQCMPETNDLPCTACETNGKPINQPMFYCNDCDKSCELLICQNCAIKFHHGHQLVYLGIVESEICQNEEFNK